MQENANTMHQQRTLPSYAPIRLLQIHSSFTSPAFKDSQRKLQHNNGEGRANLRGGGKHRHVQGDVDEAGAASAEALVLTQAHLLVSDDPPFGKVHQEDVTRGQAALVSNVLRLHIHDAHLTGHDHPVVLGQVVPARPEAIPVQGGPDKAAISEGHQGRAVPGLHDCAVKSVEVLLVLQQQVEQG